MNSEQKDKILRLCDITENLLSEHRLGAEIERSFRFDEDNHDDLDCMIEMADLVEDQIKSVRSLFEASEQNRYDLYLYSDASYKYFPHGEFQCLEDVVWCLTNVDKY